MLQPPIEEMRRDPCRMPPGPKRAPGRAVTLWKLLTLAFGVSQMLFTAEIKLIAIQTKLSRAGEITASDRILVDDVIRRLQVVVAWQYHCSTELVHKEKRQVKHVSVQRALRVDDLLCRMVLRAQQCHICR